MTTEQILVWVTIGAIGLLALMVFMYGMALTINDECSRKAFLNAENKALDARLTHSEYIIGERESELYDADKDIEQLGVIIKKIESELTAEIEARKETSELHLKTGYEPNQTQTTIDQQGLGNEWLYTNLNKH